MNDCLINILTITITPNDLQFDDSLFSLIMDDKGWETKVNRQYIDIMTVCQLWYKLMTEEVVIPYVKSSYDIRSDDVTLGTKFKNIICVKLYPARCHEIIKTPWSKKIQYLIWNDIRIYQWAFRNKKHVRSLGFWFYKQVIDKFRIEQKKRSEENNTDVSWRNKYLPNNRDSLLKLNILAARMKVNELSLSCYEKLLSKGCSEAIYRSCCLSDKIQWN